VGLRNLFYDELTLNNEEMLFWDTKVAIKEKFSMDFMRRSSGFVNQFR
jgi:hypothetical protein